jgi:hypothetical protein
MVSITTPMETLESFGVSEMLSARTLSYLDSTAIALALIAYGDPEACL